jgi:hypothetical protein
VGVEVKAAGGRRFKGRTRCPPCPSLAPAADVPLPRPATAAAPRARTSRPLRTIHQPTSPCAPPIASSRPSRPASAPLTAPLTANAAAGSTNPRPRRRPHMRWPYSHQNMNLKSSRPMWLCARRNSGERLYFSNSTSQSACVSGGRSPAAGRRGGGLGGAQQRWGARGMGREGDGARAARRWARRAAERARPPRRRLPLLRPRTHP